MLTTIRSTSPGLKLNIRDPTETAPDGGAFLGIISTTIAMIPSTAASISQTITAFVDMCRVYVPATDGDPPNEPFAQAEGFDAEKRTPPPLARRARNMYP